GIQVLCFMHAAPETRTPVDIMAHVFRSSGTGFANRAACTSRVQCMQKIILPFVAGFLASLFFRESTLALMHAAALIDPSGFSTAPFLPLGLPQFIANAICSACWALLMPWLLS